MAVVVLVWIRLLKTSLLNIVYRCIPVMLQDNLLNLYSDLFLFSVNCDDPATLSLSSSSFLQICALDDQYSIVW